MIHIRVTVIHTLLHALLAIVLMALAITVVDHSITRLMVIRNPLASFVTMYDGTADRPFIYRVLLPQIAHMAVNFTPLPWRDAIASMALKTWLVHRSVPLPLRDPEHLFAATVMVALMCISLAVYAFTLRRLSLACFPHTRVTAWITAFFGIFILIPFFDVDLKLYDFPVLALFALSLLALCRRRWGMYLFWFGLACLNKESAILFVGYFALTCRNALPLRSYLILLALQCATYVIIGAVIRYHFAANHGVMFYFRPYFIMHRLFYDLQMPGHMLAILAVYWLMVSRWTALPAMLRYGLWFMAADAAVYYLCGHNGEYRVFFEAFPPMTVIAAFVLCEPLERAVRYGGQNGAA